MGWWLLRLSAKSLALLRLSVNFYQLRLTKKFDRQRQYATPQFPHPLSSGKSVKLYLYGPRIHKVQTLTTKDCKGPQTNMPENVGSIKT